MSWQFQIRQDRFCRFGLKYLCPCLGVYRLCGSATKKRILREAFERNPRMIDLSPDNVPDINVITGKILNACFVWVVGSHFFC